MVCRQYITKSREVAVIFIIYYHVVVSGQEELESVDVETYEQFLPSGFLIRDPVMQSDFICRPGSTYIKTQSNKRLDSEIFWNELRNMDITQLSPCSICLCSSDGKKEDCLERLGENTNECVRMALLTKKLGMLKPHDHWKSLFYRIRRGGQVNEAKLLRSTTQCEPFTSRLRTCVTDSTIELCRTCTCTEQGRWHCHRSQTSLVQQEEVHFGDSPGEYDDLDLPSEVPEYSIPPRGIVYDSPEDEDPAPNLQEEYQGLGEQVFRVPNYPVRPAHTPKDMYPVGVVHTFYV